MKKYFLITIVLLVCIFVLTACESTITTTSTNSDVVVANNNTFNPTIQESGNSKKQEEIKYTEIKISSPKDLYQNIKPYTKLILTEDYYNISIIDSVTFKSDYVKTEDEYDGYEFVIHDVDHIEICSADNMLPEFVTEGAHVNVINLKNCKDVTIDGLILGHEVEKGSCFGGVILLDNCKNININNCHLYGCGTYGIISRDSDTVTVNNTEIYECSYGILDLNSVSNFTFNNCIFRNNANYTMLALQESNKIGFNNCIIVHNTCSEGSSLISSYGSNNITFTKCLFQDNEYEYFSSTEDEAQFIGCYFKDKNFNNKYYMYYEED